MMADQFGVDAELTASWSRETARVTALDALRGVGALVVVIYHLDLIFDCGSDAIRASSMAGGILRNPALHWLIAGRGMVLLFFLLSGYALSLSLDRKISYGRYLVRRLTRLALPGIAAVLFAAALYALSHAGLAAGSDSGLNHIGWDSRLSWGELAQSVFLIGTRTGIDLDPSIWSLVIELRISMLFPAMYWLTRRWPVWMGAISVVYFVGCYVLVARDMDNVPAVNAGIGQACFNLGYYAPLFVFGILAKNYNPAIRGFLGQFPRSPVVSLGAAAMVLTCWQLIYSSDTRATVGALLILIAVTAIPELGKAISVVPLRWLGRVSFSLYLVHFPVAAAMVGLLRGRVGRLELAMTILVGSLLVAEVFYRLVEAPAMALGRRWTREPRVEVSVVAG